MDDPANTISILVATDNHVGAWERNPTRGDVGSPHAAVSA
jgi:hypothetical protein